MLTWASTLYLAVSIFSDSKEAYIESLTIYFSIMFMCLISGSLNYKKEKQYLKLHDEINNQKVTVFRGAYGTARTVPIKDLVVGDVVQIQQGDRVPADCIIIDEIGLKVD